MDIITNKFLLKKFKVEQKVETYCVSTLMNEDKSNSSLGSYSLRIAT